MNLTEPQKYPRRVKEFQDAVRDARKRNGEEITRKEHWDLTVRIAESQLDMWDVLIALGKRKDWFRQAVVWFVTASLPSVISAIVIWFLLSRHDPGVSP